MSSHCSKCGKPKKGHFDDHDFYPHNRDFDHHNNDHHHSPGHNHSRDDFICEKFICDDSFKVRLGGLTHGLNFRLRQLIGCKVKLNVECGEDCEKILAEICHVGTNFVEVKVLKKLSDHVGFDELEEEVNQLQEELDSLLEEALELDREIAELEGELEDLEDEEEREEDEEEDHVEDEKGHDYKITDKLKHLREKRHKLKKKKKKHRKSKFAIFRLDAIKWYEIDCDCGCDCH